MGDLAVTIVVTVLVSIPLSLSMWALLDAARHPPWVWALTDRRQVVWIGGILFGVLVLPVGLVVSTSYLARVRPRLASVEGGDVA
jgi:hypothetical protein